MTDRMDAGLAAGADEMHIKIPTETMEQEFALHYKRGYADALAHAEQQLAEARLAAQILVGGLLPFVSGLPDNMRDMASKGRSHLQKHPEVARAARRLKGEDQPRSKLTDDKVRAIRAKYAAGSSQRNLAAEFGVSDTVIYCAVNRKTWKHV